MLNAHTLVSFGEEQRDELLSSLLIYNTPEHQSECLSQKHRSQEPSCLLLYDDGLFEEELIVHVLLDWPFLLDELPYSELHGFKTMSSTLII